MKTLLVFCLLISFATVLIAQKQTFDLLNYIPPAGGGWTKEEKKNVVVFSKVDKSSKTWCQIGVYKSTTSKGSIEADLQSEWNELAVKQFNIIETMQATETQEANGWKIKSASGKFNFNNQAAAIILTTYSGFERCVSIVCTTNSQLYLDNIESFVAGIDLKKPGLVTSNVQGDKQIKVGETQKESLKQTGTYNNPSVTNSGFAFTTTNFDDGWISTVSEDWVEATKGSIRVLLHFPKEGTIFPADPEPMTTAAWNILVAPRYSNLKNYKTSYISTYDRPYLGMGYATENATGKNVFIVFFHRGSSVWMEFIAPDKNTFMQQYKFDPETIRWDSDDALMNPLLNMSSYNRFAVAASDLKGKWTSDFTGIQQLYYVYTGQYAGMNINQSNEEFIFNNGNSYNWKLLAVNGIVGNVKAIEVKSAGKFTVPNNWQIYFSKIENTARTFHAFWSCIKGARVLNLLDANAPGSGIYTKYGLAK